MSDREHHCPFLNRADHRCSDFFSIERLQHAFEHCFDAYKSCGVYHELLVERQARRNQAAGGNPAGATYLWATACPQPTRQPERDATPRAATRFVQVRLPSVASGAVAAAAAAQHHAAGAGGHGYAKHAP